MKSGNSAPKAAYRINWSVGSYGIFIRTRKVTLICVVLQLLESMHSIQCELAISGEISGVSSTLAK